MDIIDSKYIGLISSRLDKFKRIKPNLYNFRCPICGDSQKHKNKARGYFYQVKVSTNFKCHNCGASSSFKNFLKGLDTTLYKQYTMEKFKEGFAGIKGSSTVEAPDFKKLINKPVFKKKLNIDKASKHIRASKYLKSRKINPDKFYYTEKFKRYCNTLKATFSDTAKDHARIVIPLYDENKNLIGIQGRSMDAWVQPKYLTLMFDEDAPKIYGLDEVDKTLPVYVVEGPFDSTFVKNSVAMCGSDSGLSFLEDSELVYTYDNEPRNKEICDRIIKCIKKGRKVVIWPSNVQQKDINDMVLSGRNIQTLLESNTYSGLEAELKFNTWKKV